MLRNNLFELGKHNLYSGLCVLVERVLPRLSDGSTARDHEDRALSRTDLIDIGHCLCAIRWSATKGFRVWQMFADDVFSADRFQAIERRLAEEKLLANILLSLENFLCASINAESSSQYSAESSPHSRHSSSSPSGATPQLNTLSLSEGGALISAAAAYVS